MYLAREGFLFSDDIMMMHIPVAICGLCVAVSSSCKSVHLCTSCDTVQ